MNNYNTPYAVTALYKFFQIDKLRVEVIKDEITEFCNQKQILGLILLSTEGINGTVSGLVDAIAEFKLFIKNIPEIAKLSDNKNFFKDSFCNFIPFKRLKVDIRKEIVTLNRPDIVPVNSQNHHLSPQEWHKVITTEDGYVLVDTRNYYEVEIGKFKGALDPKTKHFSEFPKFVKEQNYPKDKKILMYCTGGIRCEKALAYMQKEGYKNVYQLDGGILNYIDEFKNKSDQSLWEGECFIFDHRVALDHNLEPSKRYYLCPHCGNPGDVHINCAKCNKHAVICKHCENTPSLITCSKNCEHHFLRSKFVSVEQSLS